MLRPAEPRPPSGRTRTTVVCSQRLGSSTCEPGTQGLPTRLETGHADTSARSTEVDQLKILADDKPGLRPHSGWRW